LCTRPRVVGIAIGCIVGAAERVSADDPRGLPAFWRREKHAQIRNEEGVDRTDTLCHNNGVEKALLNTLSEGATAIGISLGQTALEQFAAYYRELLLWNRRINLVSEKSSREIVIRHFLDSLTAVPSITCRDGLLIDLGSGAGFPGIPLRIALPELQLMLVESSRKKTSFLAHIVRTLPLDGVTVVRERIEALVGEKALAGSFDTVLSRAAFKLPQLIRMASFFLKERGILIAMKGGDPGEEMAEAETILSAVGMALASCRDVRLPENDLSRKIVTYRRLLR
jgi:16S rRNA (guanine527-N7)-methyltransferase